MKGSCVLVETGVNICFIHWTNSEAQLVSTWDSLMLASWECHNMQEGNSVSVVFDF